MNLNITINNELTAREAAIVAKALGGYFKYDATNDSLVFVSTEEMKTAIKRIVFSDQEIEGDKSSINPKYKALLMNNTYKACIKNEN